MWQNMHNGSSGELEAQHVVQSLHGNDVQHFKALMPSVGDVFKIAIGSFVLEYTGPVMTGIELFYNVNIDQYK